MFWGLPKLIINFIIIIISFNKQLSIHCTDIFIILYPYTIMGMYMHTFFSLTVKFICRIGVLLVENVTS